MNAAHTIDFNNISLLKKNEKDHYINEALVLAHYSEIGVITLQFIKGKYIDIDI